MKFENTGFLISEADLTLEDVRRYIFNPEPRPIALSPSLLENVEGAHRRLNSAIDRGVPIYGVTTGFGDSCFRVIPKEKSAELQKNLSRYLACGTGELLPQVASKATLLFRLKSLGQGYSGVSTELLERMKMCLDNDWIPAIPRQGSLGASGDLVPLAYISQMLQGEGLVHDGDSLTQASDLLDQAGVKPYTLKPKEGIAIVNGTSAMAGFSLLNIQYARAIAALSGICSAWLCLALKGRVEAFGELVNEKAKKHPGQSRAARRIRELLEAENYRPTPAQNIAVQAGVTSEFIQDRYSLRCSPQILGPVLETLDLCERWLETEVNGVSDNPLIDADGTLGLGGNFYGGYLSHSMDYLKISLAQIADMYDRQFTLLIDEKSNRGLPANLADWPSMPESERFLHHGLKGLHQSVSAITSEIMARANPNSTHSRSSESHNQDKVSLGMSAASQTHELLESLFHVQSMY
ncbi:MAG: aromatic amino acid ammonia-lyase, partial [Bdellovibrionia bacterium]